MRSKKYKEQDLNKIPVQEETKVRNMGRTIPDGLRYSPEVIRQYEDPAFARASEAYEREQMALKSGRQQDMSVYFQEDQPGGDDGRKKKKKRGPIRRTIRFIFFLIILLFIALCAYIFTMAGNLDRVPTSKGDLAIDSGVAKDLSMYRTIAVLGSDARADESYDGSRTDAIVIFRIHRLTGKVKMISVMRDSYLMIDDGAGNLFLDKVTHAHHYGGGADTVAALNRSLDLNIKEYLVFNWKAVADMVDTLGGITVNVKKNEIKDMNKYGNETAENVGSKYKKIKKSGSQVLDGAQAATYCRIRKSSGGDSARANRYKKVMTAVIKKAITSPQKLGELSEKVMPEIRTNMSQLDVLTAVLRAPTFQFEKGVSWPKDYYGGILPSTGLWYAVPRTLSSNVKWLHKKAFDQKGYQLSDTAARINDDIIYGTGIQ